MQRPPGGRQPGALSRGDAGVIIGFLDDTDAHHDAAHAALGQAHDRNDRLVLPASAHAEVLVGLTPRLEAPGLDLS